MVLKILRVDEKILTCELDDGQVIDIDKKWFSDELKVDDVIDIDITKIG